MDLQEIKMMSDFKKIEYIKENISQIDETDLFDVLKTIKNTFLKFSMITNKEIGLSFDTKMKYIRTFSKDKGMAIYFNTIYEAQEETIKNATEDEKEKYVEYMEKHKEIYAYRNVLVAIGSDDFKLEYLERQGSDCNEFNKALLIASFKSDSLKLRYIRNDEIETEVLAVVIASLDDDKTKTELLKIYDGILPIYDVETIVKSLKTDDIKIEKIEQVNAQRLFTANIIASLSSDEEKIKYLNDERYNFDNAKKVIIIQSLRDASVKMENLLEIKDKIISREIRDIILSLTNDEDKINAVVKYDLKLESHDIILILERLSDKEKGLFLLYDEIPYIDADGKEQIRRLKIEPENKAAFIVLFADDKKKVEILKNVKLDNTNLAKVIAEINDKEVKKEILDNSENHFDSDEKTIIICSFDDDELKEKFINDEANKITAQQRKIIICSMAREDRYEKFGLLADEKHKKETGLPANMTIGIELEAEGKGANMLKYIGSSLLKGWETVEDGSLKEGVEFVSPILHDTQEDMYGLANMCNIIKEVGLNTTERTGGHIHYGADFFGTDLKAWENFFTIYNECEEIIYKMSNRKGELPREGVAFFATTSNDTISKMFETGEVSIKTQEDYENVIKALQDSRNRGVNVTNIGQKGKNTIEFRMPNGNINIDELRQNIKLFGSLLSVSKQMADNPAYKKEEYNILKKKDLTEAEKTEMLLAILFDEEEEKDIYRQRWDAVKNYSVFDELSAKKATFGRGDYSLKEEIIEMIKGAKGDISPEDKAYVSNMYNQHLDKKNVSTRNNSN